MNAEPYYLSLKILPDELKALVASGLVSFVPNPPMGSNQINALRKGRWKWKDPNSMDAMGPLPSAKAGEG